MKKTNIFEKFRDYQARKVDNPNYTPLGQPILEQTPTKEEVRKAKRREYQSRYYEKHKEKMREYMREYYKNYRSKLPQKHWLKWVQLRVYDYMVEQYQLYDSVPRATQIAKALNVKEQTIYNATAVLVKKWYIGRWALGYYYLINPPVKEECEVKNELKIMWETFDEPEMVYVEENKYDEMEKKIKELEEQVSNSVWHIDWLMNSNAELEKKNIDLLHQINELKLLIRLLYKYFGNV